ncbi:MAG: hypothetical protein ACTSQZ_09910 [Candidatus Thorarchaeota archaeon]
MHDSENTDVEDSVEEYNEEMELSYESEGTVRVKKLALAAVFAALSIAITPIALYIPRVPFWGIALFDPVSLFWIIAFLLGGGWVGLVTMGAGAVALNFFDLTPIIGPLMKVVATLPLIVIPWLAVRSSLNGGTRAPISKIPILGKKIKSGMSEGERLSKLPVYLTLMIPAFLLRLALMIPLNLVIVPILWGLDDVGFIIGYTLVLNSLQTIFDVVVPYIVVYPTKIFKHFKLW